MSIVHNVHNHKNASEIDQILSQYVPAHVVSYLIEAGIQIVPLPNPVTYADASRVLRRMGINVDSWPIPPAGLFVVEERTMYIRTVSSMTIVHELGHALDCALGGGVYRSGFDPTIRRAFEMLLRSLLHMRHRDLMSSSLRVGARISGQTIQVAFGRRSRAQS